MTTSAVSPDQQAQYTIEVFAYLPIGLFLAYTAISADEKKRKLYTDAILPYCKLYTFDDVNQNYRNEYYSQRSVLARYFRFVTREDIWHGCCISVYTVKTMRESRV